MQFESAHLSCPLCKRHLSANSSEHSLSTRLCQPCQTLVLTAFRGGNSFVATSAPLSTNGAVLDVESEAAPFDPSRVAELFEDGATESPTFEHDSQFPGTFDEPESISFDFFHDEDSHDRIQAEQAPARAFSGNGASRNYGEFSREAAYSIGTIERESAEVAGSRLTVAPIVTEPENAPVEISASLAEDRSEQTTAIVEEAVTDPWATPLPAWDYSQSEWPVLVGPTKRRPPRRVRPAIAGAVLLATLAGFYFLINRPSAPTQGRSAADTAATVKASTVEPRAVAASSAEPVGASRPAPQAEGSPASEKSKAESPAPGATDTAAKGRFSLQAAAFPTLGGAEEFAEKLKKAGVASYVVPAELARRGTWFRVRVGRFGSAEDAQRFAGEAQQRARAVGLAVQLIVCQHEQP